MEQVQLYLSPLLLKLNFAEFLTMETAVFVSVGIVLLYTFREFRACVQKYANKINLLECNLRETNEKYEKLNSEFTRLFSQQIYQLNLHLSEETANNHKSRRHMENRMNELKTKLLQRIRSLEDGFTSIEIKEKEARAAIEGEIHTLRAELNNDFVFVGYSFDLNGGSNLIPVIKNVNDNIIISHPVVVINQLKFFKNVKEVYCCVGGFRAIFIFDPLFDISYIMRAGNTGGCRYEQLATENNSNYFAMPGGTDFDGCSYRGAIGLYEKDKPIQTYVKNGIRKLQSELAKFNIELKMPDELREFVFAA